MVKQTEYSKAKSYTQLSISQQKADTSNNTSIRLDEYRISFVDCQLWNQTIHWCGSPV